MHLGKAGGDTGSSFYKPAGRLHEHFLAGLHGYFFTSSGNGCVEQFAGEDGRIGSGGQDYQNLLKFGSLAFMDGHGESGFGLGEVAGQDSFERAGTVFEPGQECAAGVGAYEAGVAVEEAMFIVVAGEDDGAMGIKFRVGTDEFLLLQVVFDGFVDGVESVFSFTDGAEDTEVIQFPEGGANVWFGDEGFVAGDELVEVFFCICGVDGDVRVGCGDEGQQIGLFVADDGLAEFSDAFDVGEAVAVAQLDEVLEQGVPVVCGDVCVWYMLLRGVDKGIEKMDAVC